MTTPVLEWTDLESGLWFCVKLTPQIRCDVEMFEDGDRKADWLWSVYLDVDGECLHVIKEDYAGESVDAAKLAAETFAREWVARQAVALGDGWISCQERLPDDGDGWYHVAAHDYKGRYPRHGIAQFTRDRFWIDGDDGEGDSVFAWRHPALPPLPEVK